MKSAKAALGSIDGGNLSIPAAEEIIEEALNELAYSQDPGLVRALRFLAPEGYQAIVELCSENGRSKRRNASADTWSPDDDEVRIYFERIDEVEASPRAVRTHRAGAVHVADEEEDDAQEAVLPADMDARVKELCAALAEAERVYCAEVVPGFISSAQGIPVEPASGNAADGAGRGNPARRCDDEQDRESEDAGIPDDDHPPEPRGGGDSGRGTEVSSGCRAGGTALRNHR
jgi:hypothetical protein